MVITPVITVVITLVISVVSVTAAATPAVADPATSTRGLAAGPNTGTPYTSITPAVADPSPRAATPITTNAGITSAAGSRSVADRVAESHHTGEDFLAIFDEAHLPGLDDTDVAPRITGDLIVDSRIRSLAERRGYRRRPESSRALTRTDGFLLQPQASSAWEELQAFAADAGLTIRLRSGYRSITRQAALFRARLAGTSEAAIARALARVAPPGYSKHHTGYAIDIDSPSGGGYDFALTDEYAWLAADNFAVAKIHGFVPSYPYGTSGGPDPEPWEFVWVGAGNILCRDFEPSAEERFCDAIASPFAEDIDWMHERGITTGCASTRFCTNDPATRAEAATFLWRLLGEPASTAEIDFGDVPDDVFYTEPIRWLVENGFTTGTGPSRFSPNNHITREQLFTLLWRIAGRPVVTGGFPFADVDPLQYSAPATLWAVMTGLTSATSQTTFSPTSPMDREAVAEVIRRYDHTSEALRV